jgi:hypothetical protein
MSHFFWLAALLALRHSGLEQYCWCRALRGSGRKKTPQLLHFRFLVRFAIDLSSADNHQVNNGVFGTKYFWKKEREKKKEEEERIFMKLFWKKIKVRKPTFSYRRF